MIENFYYSLRLYYINIFQINKITLLLIIGLSEEQENYPYDNEANNKISNKSICNILILLFSFLKYIFMKNSYHHLEDIVIINIEHNYFYLNLLNDIEI